MIVCQIMRRVRLPMLAVWVSLVFSTQSAQANVGEAYGFGSRNASLAGAGVAWGQDGFAAYLNPAALAVEKVKRLDFSYGWTYMQPNFKAINNVVTQNAYIADNAAGSPTYANVDTSYKNTVGQEIGFGYRLLPDSWNLSIGVSAFLPFEQIAFMDSGETYVPEYMLYRARTQRPQVDLGVGAAIGAGFHLGVGLHAGFALTSNASLFLNTASNTISTMRFSSSLKPKLAPFFGALFVPEDDPQAYSIGAVFRLPLTSDNTIALNSSARAFGNLAAVDFNFTGTSALFYDPMAIELGGSFRHFNVARFFGQLEYQFWSNYQSPAILIQQPETTNCTPPGSCGTLRINPGKLPGFTFVNILVPRVGEEIQLTDSMTVRVGYAYRPSILDGVPNGSGNYLDPAKHMANVGLGLRFDRFFSFNQPWNLDFNLAYQYLVTQQITKTAGNEIGTANDLKIGAPGYEAGGNLFGGGVSLTLAI